MSVATVLNKRIYLARLPPELIFFLCLSVPDTNAYRLDQILLYVLYSYPKC